MAKLVQPSTRAASRRRAATSSWFEPRVTVAGDPHAPGRRLDDPRPLRRRALDHVARGRHAQRGARRHRRVPADARAGGRRGPLRAQGAADGGRPTVAAPGRARPRRPGVKAMEQAVADVRGEPGEVRKFNGGWVDAVELMRTGGDGYGVAGRDHLRPRRLRAGARRRRAHRAGRRRRGGGDLRRGHAYAACGDRRGGRVARAYEQLAGRIRGGSSPARSAPGATGCPRSWRSPARPPSAAAPSARRCGCSRRRASWSARARASSSSRHPRGDEPALREATRGLRHSDVTFDDLHEALLALDPALTRLATERADDAEIERLERHLEEQERCSASPRPGAASTTSST